LNRLSGKRGDWQSGRVGVQINRRPRERDQILERQRHATPAGITDRDWDFEKRRRNIPQHLSTTIVFQTSRVPVNTSSKQEENHGTSYHPTS
jgi:hypothetical protein